MENGGVEPGPGNPVDGGDDIQPAGGVGGTDEPEEPVEPVGDPGPGAVNQPPDFKAQLQELLLQHGKTLKDLTQPAELQDLVIKHEVTASSHTLKRLRQFSGTQPLPNGEVSYKAWRQSARQLLQESDFSVKEKKLRIKQSLVGQAGEVVIVVDKKAAKNGELAAPADYLSALDKMFGVCHDADDLYSEYRALYQQEGEDPGNYLVRLYNKLDEVIEYGGADECQRERLLLGQFIRGCLHDEYLIEKLQLEGKRSAPPDYITLLHDIRTAAAKHNERAARRKQQRPTKARVHQQDVHETPTSPSKMESIERQLMQLSQAVQTLTIGIKSTQREREPTPPQQNYRPAYRRRSTTRGPCYNCGEEGHYKANCKNETNATLVQQKLAGRQPQGNGRGRLQRANQVPNQH